MNLNTVSIALQFLCFTFAVAAGNNDPIQVKGDTSSVLNGRNWLGDVQHTLSSMLQIKGSSTALSGVIPELKSIDLVDGKGILEGFQIVKLSNPDNSLAGTNPLPPAQTAESHTSGTLLSILGLRNVIATIAVVVTSLINVSVYKLREMWEANRIDEKNKPSARADRVCRRFSLAEIELATRNFSAALVIGRGGFGNVYEGFIDNRQEKVAIKRQKFTSSQGAHEFLTEIEMLSELRHINLVSLIGYCNDHGEMILVYEYMASGTLADHLYKLERGKDSCSSLSWKRRLNICIAAGRGLDYLHTGHGTIHRDVKSSNILLDENFVAKVADFGLAKPEDRKELQSHITTKVKGTPGYFDPFYLSTCRLTRKSDTYAFGVVLLEVLCGRPAVDSKLDEEERILSKWALNKINQGEVHEIVASCLRDEFSADSLKTFVGVAERCLYAEPKNRPTMAQVVLQLELALEQQEGRQLPGSNEMANVSDVIHAHDDAIELKMASVDAQYPTPLPKDQTNSRVIDGELPHAMKGGRKTILHKPWGALWSWVRPSRTDELLLSEISEAGMKLAKFDWNTIADATNHFSLSNKVGEGGFGSVYKAMLPTGLVVAVKRLSPYSRQGRNEFKNEILSLPNLQHRNIIKLLGYCIHREERLLVYEFMENGSLDAYLADVRRECLDWQVRMKIITGIARAILYLHRDSGQSVTHTDLKPSNILVDGEMNPKLSDFGLARSLEDDQSELQIFQTIGTYDYLPPEYCIYGNISTKVDIFSFGMVVLEVVSGRRSIIAPDQYPILLSKYAWDLWKEGTAFDLIDQSLQDTFPLEEALKCIQVGLLCTQTEPHDRPNIYRVIKMLEGDEPLVEPKKPWSRILVEYSSSNIGHTSGTSKLDGTLGTSLHPKSFHSSTGKYSLTDVLANAFSRGGIHPLTRYVMNHIKSLSDRDEHEDDYNDINISVSTSPDMSPLSQDEQSGGNSSNSPIATHFRSLISIIESNLEDKSKLFTDEQFGGNSSNSPMATHFWSLISIIESDLEDKSKLFKDESLQHLFLMNNIHYMVEKVKNSKLRNVLGDDWIRKQNWKFQQHAMNYERATWSSILGLLKDEGLQHPGSNSVSKTILKERLQSFYGAFEEVYKNQTSWLIPDSQLRDDLRISASLKVIQAYRTFVGRYSNHFSVKHIKYSADDLEDFLLDFFEGSQKSLHGGHKK